MYAAVRLIDGRSFDFMSSDLSAGAIKNLNCVARPFSVEWDACVWDGGYDRADEGVRGSMSFPNEKRSWLGWRSAAGRSWPSRVWCGIRYTRQVCPF